MLATRPPSKLSPIEILTTRPLGIRTSARGLELLPNVPSKLIRAKSIAREIVACSETEAFVGIFGTVTAAADDVVLTAAVDAAAVALTGATLGLDWAAA